MTRLVAAPVEFWFEFASTYSYPAACRIEAAAAVAKVQVAFKPFLLGPIFANQGWKDSPFNIYPVKGRYMWRDLERICSRLDLPFKKPTVFPRNGLAAARITVATEEAARPRLVARIYRANFAEDRDIGSREVLADILAELGHDVEDTLARAESQAVKDTLRAETERATALGIFGSPSLTVGSELFWGNDRIEDALDWALRSVSRDGVKLW
jgi:2-hydroxychromene-2-carboxylate isomerase